ADEVGAQRTAELNSPSAPLLQRSIVEERVGVRVQDLVTERRRLGVVDGHSSYGAGADSVQDFDQAVEIHGLMQAVVDRLSNQRVIGDADLAAQVFRAGNLIRENGRQQ